MVADEGAGARAVFGAASGGDTSPCIDAASPPSFTVSLHSAPARSRNPDHVREVMSRSSPRECSSVRSQLGCRDGPVRVATSVANHPFAWITRTPRDQSVFRDVQIEASGADDARTGRAVIA